MLQFTVQGSQRFLGPASFEAKLSQTAGEQAAGGEVGVMGAYPWRVAVRRRGGWPGCWGVLRRKTAKTDLRVISGHWDMTRIFVYPTPNNSALT